MKKSTKTLLGAAAGAAAITVLNQVSARGLMKVAMNRKLPKNLPVSRKRLMGSGNLLQMVQTLEEAGAKLEQADTELTTVRSHDGLKLVGHFRPCENPRRMILAMHGWRSSWSRDMGVIADFWHENGCSVLFAEQRGQGGSDGDYMGFGLLERHDCRKWAEYLAERAEGLPVYLAGVSMGATTVLMAAGEPLPDCVRGIIADCGFTSPQAIWKHVTENNLHLPFDLYSHTADRICRKRLSAASDGYSCPEALQNCKVPVLFIHGTDDRFVPVEMTYENYKACPSKKHLFVVPGADHGMSYLLDKDGYEEAVLQFWQECEA